MRDEEEVLDTSFTEFTELVGVSSWSWRAELESGVIERSWRQERRSEAGEPTGAREHVCGPGVILTASVKGAREGARVKIMLVGCPQTAGRASRSGAGLAFGRRQLAIGYYRSAIADS